MRSAEEKSEKRTTIPLSEIVLQETMTANKAKRAHLLVEGWETPIVLNYSAAGLIDRFYNEVGVELTAKEETLLKESEEAKIVMYEQAGEWKLIDGKTRLVTIKHLYSRGDNYGHAGLESVDKGFLASMFCGKLSAKKLIQRRR